MGTLAALAGAVVVAAAAALLGGENALPQFGAIALAGLSGSIIDSVLGATVQGIYRCERDQRITEKHPLHSCGSPTVLVRGWAWLNNDWVNVVCTAAGAGLGCALSALFRVI